MIREKSTLDVSYARSQIPTIRSHDGTFVFADNAGVSATLESAALKVADYLMHSNVQLKASYPLAKHSTQLIGESDIAGQRLINAASNGEVVLGISATQLLENLARSMEPFIVEGHDEIIITDTEHEANAGPFVKLAKRKNLTVHVWKCNPESMELELDSLKALLNQKTRLVCVAHCSNILGTVNNIKSIIDLVHAIPGAEVCVDGVALAGHRLVDVQAWNPDYYSISYYKIFGPHISQLYIADRCRSRLSSLVHYFLKEDVYPAAFQPGNVNPELVAALPAVLGYLGDLGRPSEERLGIQGQRGVRADVGATRQELIRAYAAIADQETILANKFLGYLTSKPNAFRIFGRKVADEDRIAIISVTVAGMSSEEFVRRIDKLGVGIRHGHFFSHRFVCGSQSLTADGVVRVSFAHYNTLEEVDIVIAAFESASQSE
ncbi:cysteine desulfurase-like protein [Rhizoclosmatium globosum]|uniref:Cysteine desulfurase-like protein n=1 Tax=Rhizoclosmatium globosum TaxID=329046 RepID=A0A1Y2AGG2_9FUNG|nr:cysteine desulfurase-like protein [Rhizoclosmatium globosum]|eukprot:ORY21572.1 cysteine desulfurase-like protein [Rhizoclosmatium globosum]